MKNGPVASIRRAFNALRPSGAVDAFARGKVAGWAFAPGGVWVEAWVDGECVARVRPAIPRVDVADAYPGAAGALKSGFLLDLAEHLPAQGYREFKLVANPVWPMVSGRTLGRFTVVADALVAKLLAPPESGISGPFPKPVIDLVAAEWPEDCRDLSTFEGQRRFIFRLEKILATETLKSLPVIADYYRFLSSTLNHCRFVEKCFPVVNVLGVDGADFHCKPNSVSEIFSIIHQLYVLKSWGVAGDFAEFGCFKGYSSSMLSFACQQLGLKMHIFDSFEGLPAAPGSGYQQGQYAGSMEEVRDHVTRFGAIDAVEFHKGFFADSLKVWRPDKLMCLWMDVDLEVSAQDLMIVADRVDERGTLFSHECSPDIFQDGAIVSEPHPDNPVRPLLDRHVALGRPLTGHHVAGYTGVFWPRSTGTPAPTPNALSLLRKAVA